MGKPDSTMMVMVGCAWVPHADEARAVGTIYRIKKRPRIFVAKIPAECLSAVDLKGGSLIWQWYDLAAWDFGNGRHGIGRLELSVVPQGIVTKYNGFGLAII
jgi:hypothetical protein